MSVERRLREGLERSAATVQPDVGLRLPEAIARGRRHRRARRASLIAGTVAALAVIGVAVPQVTGFIQRSQHPSVQGPTATPGPDAVIAGSYTSTLGATSAVIRNNGMAGTWTLRLKANGVVTLSAPRSFRGDLVSIAFRVQGDRFTTNAFVNDPRCSNDVGVYRWQRAGETLVFTPVRDRCALRRALFSSHLWHTSG